MRAIGFNRNGGPEVLEFVERTLPAPGPGEVLLDVAYAGVNFAEVQHRRGEFGAPDGPGGYDVPGLEAAGTVAAVGPGVTGVHEGQKVAAYLPAFGGYAHQVLAAADFVRPVGSVPLPLAAGLGCVHPTAYGLLLDAGRLRAGETILIHSATGGVGSAAARIARTLGAARVLGTVGSPAKLELAGRLGYDELFLRDEFATAVGPVDVVLDPVGGKVRRDSLATLNPFGRVVVYGDLARSEDWTADVLDLWKNSRSITGYNIGDVARRAPATIGDYLGRALSALASGELRAEPPAIRPWSQVVDVHREFESGATHGKTVLRIDPRD